MRSIPIGFLTYIALSVLFFGDPFQPVFLVTNHSVNFKLPYWHLIMLASFMAGTTAFLLPRRFWYARFPLFLTIGMLGSLFLIGEYADRVVGAALKRFGADRTIQNRFIDSVREVPNEYQFYLHGAALKNCIPYGWSYRTMYFYEIPPNAAVNVLPVDWRALCPSIKEGSTQL